MQHACPGELRLLKNRSSDRLKLLQIDLIVHVVDIVDVVHDFIDRWAADLNLCVIGWLNILAIEKQSYLELHTLNHPFFFIIDRCGV